MKTKEELIKTISDSSVLKQKFITLTRTNETTEREQNSINCVMLDTLNNNVGKMEKIIRKPWITQNILKKIEERRKHKNTNSVEYRRLNNELNRDTDRAKEEFNKLQSFCRG